MGNTKHAWTIGSRLHIVLIQEENITLEPMSPQPNPSSKGVN